jgi:hypothetical protein
MPTLLYKRTHNGDPDILGRFGCHDCMGRVRSLKFDSVIGVGGQGAEAKRNDIAGKVNWIGIGAHTTYVSGMVDPIVTFDHFLDYGTEGPDLCAEAPKLAKRMYVKKARVVLDFTPQERIEVERLLALAADASPSQGLIGSVKKTKRRICRPASYKPRLSRCDA